MPRSGVYRKRLAAKQAGKRKSLMGKKNETCKSQKMTKRGPSTLKSGRFLS